jgi:hypothetical protein
MRPILIRRKQSAWERHQILTDKYRKATAQHKPTDSIYREHVLLIASQLRREMKWDRQERRQQIAA